MHPSGTWILHQYNLRQGGCDRRALCLPFLRKNSMNILEATSTPCLVPWHGMSTNLSTWCYLYWSTFPGETKNTTNIILCSKEPGNHAKTSSVPKIAGRGITEWVSLISTCCRTTGPVASMFPVAPGMDLRGGRVITCLRTFMWGDHYWWIPLDFSVLAHAGVCTHAEGNKTI